MEENGFPKEYRGFVGRIEKCLTKFYWNVKLKSTIFFKSIKVTDSPNEDEFYTFKGFATQCYDSDGEIDWETVEQNGTDWWNDLELLKLLN